jgi:membrane protease YdiL (CAAX protease family)
MDGMEPTPEPVLSTAQELPVPPTPPSLLRHIFFNEVELRAGWRFLIFLVLLIVVSFCTNFAIKHMIKAPPRRNQPVELRPRLVIVGDGLSLLLILGVTAIMAAFEKRKIRYYGLPLGQALRGNFWWGCVWGFGAISALLLALRADHNFYFGAPELRGWTVAQSAFLWGIAFLLVGLSEEFSLRGYAQFTLTTGIGFWPTALLFSLLFAFLHRGNPGETIFGLFQIVLIGLFFCFTLWRTGTLWFAVGFHAAWDWGQSFFYGTLDSGIPAKGHLLHSSFAGPAWLTGGTVGPEGSVLLAPLILLLFVFFYFAFPNREPYPDPEAVPADPTRAAEKAQLEPFHPQRFRGK